MSVLNLALWTYTKRYAFTTATRDQNLSLRFIFAGTASIGRVADDFPTDDYAKRNLSVTVRLLGLRRRCGVAHCSVRGARVVLTSLQEGLQSLAHAADAHIRLVLAMSSSD